MRAGKNLARYVQPPLSNTRLDRQWAAIAERTKGATRRRWLFAAYGTGLAACAIALLVLWGRPSAVKAVAFEGAVVETSGTSAQVLTLADGLRVELAEATRLEFASIRADAIRLVLKRGRVDLDVAHVEGRTFVVSAAGIDVVVRGTRFRVVLDDGPSARLTVSVERGRVEARRKGEAEVSRPIAAGETWSTAVPLRADEAPSSAPPAIAPPPAPEEVSSEEGATADESAQAAGSSAEPSRSRDIGKKFAALVKSRKFTDAYESLGSEGFARELEHADAKRLLELADAARFSGHASEAGVALDRLRRKYRTDPRAGLAAFELGRLRMDSLHDASGALDAFTDALTLAPSAAVREDAEARRVQVLEALGNVAECSRARAAYLARYPDGVHAASIRVRCGGR